MSNTARKLKRQSELQEVEENNETSDQTPGSDGGETKEETTVKVADLAVLNQKRLLQMQYTKDAEVADSHLLAANKEVELGRAKQEKAQVEKRLAYVQLANAEEELKIVRNTIGDYLNIKENEWAKYSIDWDVGTVTKILPDDKPGG